MKPLQALLLACGAAARMSGITPMISNTETSKTREKGLACRFATQHTLWPDLATDAVPVSRKA
jgi:hypothetical protein